MADVFVSYARKNRPRVAEVSGALEASGYSLWWDRQIETGADYGMLIEEEIEAARCVLVAWSAQARQSLWVRAEANEALDSGKLVQIALDETRLPLPFTMLHFLDFSTWRGARDCEPWTGLDARVQAMLRGEPAAAAEPVLPGDTGAVPRGPALQGLGRVAWIGWAAILLAAALAGAVLMAASGGLSPAAFGGVTLIGLAFAAILLAMAAFTLIRVAAASRR
jgi:TIR domain